MDKVGSTIAAIFTSFVVIAIVGVIVSNQSQTSTVIQSATSGFASILQTIVSPITGSVS